MVMVVVVLFRKTHGGFPCQGLEVVHVVPQVALVQSRKRWDDSQEQAARTVRDVRGRPVDDIVENEHGSSACAFGRGVAAETETS